MNSQHICPATCAQSFSARINFVKFNGLPMVTTLKKWWFRLAPWPLGKWLFSKILGLVIPYTGSTKPYVVHVGPGYAEVSIRDRRANKNHLNSIHALAIANLGELTTGLALHFAMPADQRAILTRLETDFLKKARGAITARVAIDPMEVAVGINTVLAEIVDRSHTPVARVKATWLVDNPLKR